MSLRRDFQLLVLSSPSGAGKTTLTRMLLDSFQELRFSVSHTTRKARANEVDGRDYHFVERPQFLQMVQSGAFLEWAEVHGNLYGTSTNEIDRANKAAGCSGLLFDIDYQGARQIKSQVDHVTSIFVLPPSMPELERRLRGRASETEEAVQKRFTTARLEIEHYGLFDYLIVNDDLKRSFDELRSIVLAERARRTRRAHLAESLLRTGQLG